MAIILGGWLDSRLAIIQCIERLDTTDLAALNDPISDLRNVDGIPQESVTASMG